MESSYTPWDFSAALAILSTPTILHNESRSDVTSQSETLTTATSVSTAEHAEDKASTSANTLGTFDSVWAFLDREAQSCIPSPSPLWANTPSRSPDSKTSGEEVRASAPLALDRPDIAIDLKEDVPEPSLLRIQQDWMCSRKEDVFEPSLLRRQQTWTRKRKAKQVFTQWNSGTRSEVIPSSSSETYAEETAQNGEERRRKILQDMSEKPSTPAPKHRTDMETHSKLVPSSIGVQKSKQRSKGPFVLRQKDISDSVEKTAGVIDLLSQRFPGFSLPRRTHSLQPDYTSDHGGIHVFVDISNILIGFHDALKARMGIPKSSRLPRQTLSFHNLSLILERGRAVAKKILVGSDKYDTIQEAQILGYTAHILTRVTKPGKEKSTAMLSDSDSTRPLRVVKKGEQAVDEILQLHIVNSIIDSEEPSTIVLASGDAAEGEFSDGFLKAVERGLRFGWSVEIIAWRANISSAYRNPMWTSRWGPSFRIIELDDFVELLHVDRGLMNPLTGWLSTGSKQTPIKGSTHVIRSHGFITRSE